MASPQIPYADLLTILQVKAGEAVSQDLVDVLLLEIIAWLNAGPARCRDDVTDWDSLPGEAQGILLGVLARQATGGGSNVVQERVGDYSVKYSDPALFEGKLPTFLFEEEELALARIFGCGGDLQTITTTGIMPIGVSRLEDELAMQDRRLRDAAIGR